jgi:hypothetical protein
MALKVQLPPLRERATLWGRLDSSSTSVTGCFDVPCRFLPERIERIVMESIPDLGLPPAVEILDQGLKPHLPRWGEHGSDTQAQAQSHHSANDVGMLMGTLEDSVVVKLCICWKSNLSPMADQCFNDHFCSNRGHWEGRHETAVERGGIEHFDLEAAFDHKAFDNVEAVQFYSSFGNFRQMPAARWRQASHTLVSIESTAAFKNTANGSDYRRFLDASNNEFSVDCLSAKLA